jgi:hypothetical protein
MERGRKQTLTGDCMLCQIERQLSVNHVNQGMSCEVF